MKRFLQQALFNVLGWCFVLLGLVGVFLPVVPTTPFLIVALLIFARSSPRFHRMLLNNRWFGEELRQWEQERSITRQTKQKASLLIIATFSLSIGLLYGKTAIQLLLLLTCMVLLFFIRRLRESEPDAITVESQEKKELR